MQLQVLTLLACEAVAPTLSRLILDGRVREAVVHAEELLGDLVAKPGPGADVASATAQLCADLMLALDRAEEAEETYRLAVKLAANMARRGAVRVVSCRSTGFLSLHQQRFATATACFTRLVADDAAATPQRVEALCALAMARQGLGQMSRALQALDDAGQLACDAGSANLAMLASLVRVELSVRGEIRAHELLHDHVFWLPSASNTAQSHPTLQPLAALDICAAAHGHHPLVRQRLQHLRDLLRASYGEPRMQAPLMEHLAVLRGASLVALEVQARLDTTLVALARREHDFARAVLEPVQGRDAAVRRRWSMELSYCQAKLSMLSGRVEEAMQHYQRYALESMQCVRAGAVLAEHVQRQESGRPAQTCDDIEMRLPAKYRKAYRYLQSHLDCAELSVREIADDMGVTERALQSAFKAHLGMTPGEVVQRCRVERIRADLLREDAAGAGVTETAARWGIRNRSTLITSYRKYFRETPTETLARRGRADAAA